MTILIQDLLASSNLSQFLVQFWSVSDNFIPFSCGQSLSTQTTFKTTVHKCSTELKVQGKNMSMIIIYDVLGLEVATNPLRVNKKFLCEKHSLFFAINFRNWYFYLLALSCTNSTLQLYLLKMCQIYIAIWSVQISYFLISLTLC